MAIGTRLTLAGARLLAKALQGKQLKFTRGAFGDARINNKLVEPTDEQQDNLNALINERMSLPIYAFKFGENGDFLVTVKVKNENLTSTFKAAECGLFAKDPDTGSEILYGYCYEGNDGDKIHSKSSYCVLEYYLEFTTTIGNAKNVTCAVNIQEKIKAGAGLSRLGDTINANTGVGIGVSSLNNIYLKRATSTEKGGVIITGNDGLIMDEETLKPALGVGLGISAAKNIYLKRATDTEKGGVIVTGNDGLKMDGETIKAAVGTGLGISDAGNIYLKRATSTEKGGVIITGDDGLIMDGETLKATGGELESRVKQLEINQSNLYMVMNAEHELGITANLLLVEDWVKCDCTDRTATTCDADKDMVRYKCFDVLTNANFAKIGRDYSLVWQGVDRTIQISDILDGNNQAGDRAFVYYFTGDTDDLHDLVPKATSDISKPLNNAKLYRTTAGVVTGKYAYGPGNLFRQLLRRVSFNGTISSTSKTFNMSTQSGQESNFTITDGKLTSDGYFTIN